jgi:hypothetical protein
MAMQDSRGASVLAPGTEAEVRLLVDTGRSRGCNDSGARNCQHLEAAPGFEPACRGQLETEPTYQSVRRVGWVAFDSPGK